MTWPHPVLALVDLLNTSGVDHPLAPKMFPTDALQCVQEIKVCLGGQRSGMYSHSKGAKVFWDDIVAFLRGRDGAEVPVDTKDPTLSKGTSTAINQLLTALIAGASWRVRT